MRPQSCPLPVRGNLSGSMDEPPPGDNWFRTFTRVHIIMRSYQTKLYLKKVSQTSVISHKTKRAFYFLLLMVRLTFILPWRWDPDSGRIKKIDPVSLKWWRVLVCFHIFLRICIPTYVFLSLAILPIPAYEVFLTMWNIGIQILSLICLILLLIPSQELALRTIANSSFRFNRFLNRSRDLKRKSKFSEGTEDLLVSFIICVVLFAICIGPGVGYMFSTGTWKIGWVLNYLEFPFMYFFFGVGVTYFYTVDGTIVAWVVVGTILHCDLMSGWLEELKNQVKADENSDIDVPAYDRRIQIIFRAHQVLHRHVEGFTYYFVPVVLTIMLIVCITVLYSVFGLYPVLNPAVLICCIVLSAVIIIMLKFICNICGKFTINSIAYRDSFDRNIHTDKSKVDELFFKSIEPITFHIGPYKEINNSIFQPILTNVVVNWVINLLLSLERPTGR